MTVVFAENKPGSYSEAKGHVNLFDEVNICFITLYIEIKYRTSFSLLNVERQEFDITAKKVVRLISMF